MTLSKSGAASAPANVRVLAPARKVIVTVSVPGVFQPPVPGNVSGTGAVPLMLSVAARVGSPLTYPITSVVVPAVAAPTSLNRRLPVPWPTCPTLRPPEQPAQVTAYGVRGNVLTAAGPWRSAGEWWTGTCWARDEWDISLSDGALYRLYWDLRTGGWFVEGMYD